MTERVFLTIELGSGDKALDLKRALRRRAAEQDLTMSGLARALIRKETLADVLELKFAEDMIPDPNEEGRRCG